MKEEIKRNIMHRMIDGAVYKGRGRDSIEFDDNEFISWIGDDVLRMKYDSVWDDCGDWIEIEPPKYGLEIGDGFKFCPFCGRHIK